MPATRRHPGDGSPAAPRTRGVTPQSGGTAAPRRSAAEHGAGGRTGGFSGAVVRLRYVILGFWVLIVALAVPRASRVNEVLQVEGRGLRDSESERADGQLRQAFVRPVDDFFAVTVEGALPVDSPTYRALLDTLTAAAASESYITHVVSYRSTRDSSLVSKDRRTTFFVAAVVPDSTPATERVPLFRQAVRRAQDRVTGGATFLVHVTGGPALDYDVRTVSKADAEESERRALPLTAIVLVLAFGALVAAALPILVGMFAITFAFALVHIAAGFYPMSVFVLNIVSMVGLGVGIDYSLLVVTRFREELNRGLSAREAAARTMATAGLAVVTSGLTVIVGFAALFVTPLNETRSVAIGGVLVVAGSVLLAVTFLPAALAVLGRSIDLPRWLARRLAWYHAPAAWERWARWLAHHPYRAIAIGGVLVATITWPLAGIRIGLPRAGWFPTATESGAGVKALERIGARGLLQPIRILVQAPEGQRIVASKYLRGLRRLSDSIRADPRTAQIRSVVDVRPGTSLLQYSMLYSDLAAARARSPDFYD
ncbi:MAG: MMPL family transporter, partial [Gemmatimonadetes bacterium]|nr:MMPL family transporter [Gemmatimonadota bacterium]